MWRYGPETDRLVREILEQEHWSAEKWKNWQAERLAFVLHRAATKVPYYKRLWSERRRRGDRSSFEYLENWPILTKETLRQMPKALLAEDCDPRKMYRDHTSGTSGTPLFLWCSKATVRMSYALWEARIRLWNGVSRHDSWAILGGQPVVHGKVQKPPFWVRNAPMNQLYLSANHISRHNVRAYIDAIREHRVTHIIGYTSAVAHLSSEAVEMGLPPLNLKAVITNAEALFSWQRATISASLSPHVRESYGNAELVASASECSAGMLHMWPEMGLLEVLDDDDQYVPIGTAGRFIATSFLNTDMPLIRYQVGDRGTLSAVTSKCACGRTLPVVSNIEGRINEGLITREGRRVYLPTIFNGLPLQEAQIIQEEIDEIRVRYVPSSDFQTTTGRTMIGRLQSRLGDVHVILQREDRIPRAANGKFKPVVCNVTDPQNKVSPTALVGTKKE